MIPLVSDVYTATQANLNDVAKEVYTDAVCQPFYRIAYSTIYRAMQMCQSPKIRKQAFYNLPINTAYLDPATAGITNLGELETVEERAITSSVAITAATPGASTCSITAAGHGFATGNQIVIYGIVGITEDVNGIWTITVTNPNVFTLNGCTATGTWSSGGVATLSTEDFAELRAVDSIPDITAAPGGELGEYSWMGDVFRFPASSSIRQLRITYTLSGNAPLVTTASTGIDDSLDFLAAYTAAYVAHAKGEQSRYQVLKEMAVGPPQAMGMGGLLREFLTAGVRGMQKEQYARPLYRTPRSNTPRIF